ncbi:MAG TPA: hypothetical protein VNZ53_19400 [Steroidobacteraceae bacterium]|jgi:hypothetical protein|nr:hypothetical protein [Steroidobacteraceae bacterium]
MGLIIGNRALQGSSNLPYLQQQTFDGEETWVPLTFLDRNRVPVVPTSIRVELDDLTNSVQMDNGPLTLNPLGASTTSYTYPAFSSGSPTPWLLQLSATLMQMTYPYQGSQICKLKLVWKAVDSVTAIAFGQTYETIFELVSTPTVSGSL